MGGKIPLELAPGLHLEVQVVKRFLRIIRVSYLNHIEVRELPSVRMSPKQW